MKEFLIASTMVWNAALEELFRQVYECGLGGMEFWAQHFYCRQYEEEQYRRLSVHYPVHTAVHSCSWDLNLCSMNEGIRRTSVEEVIRSMQLACRLGASEVTVHPGHLTMPGWRAQSVAAMHRSFQEIADASYRMDMPVSLEIMEKAKKEFVTNIEVMKEVTGDLFSFFSYTVDVAHCDSEEEIFCLLEQLPKVSKIHISNRVGTQYHTPLTDGDYNFADLLPKLHSYHIPMVVEGYDPDGSWRTFWQNVTFLQAQHRNVQYRIS